MAAGSWTPTGDDAALLAGVLLSLYLFNWRSALVVLMTVSAAIMMALLVLY
jgi:Cu/Ag efflux pump CusA